MAEIKDNWLAMKRNLALSGLTQVAIATGARVDQASVSRILRKPPRRAGRAFIALCKYATRIDTRKTKHDPRQNFELMKALGAIWDGTDLHADAIAQVILAAGHLAENTFKR